MQWVKASERLPAQKTKNLLKDKPVIFKNDKQAHAMAVYLSVTPNPKALIKDDFDNWFWLNESPSTELQQAQERIKELEEENKGLTYVRDGMIKIADQLIKFLESRNSLTALPLNPKG